MNAVLYARHPAKRWHELFIPRKRDGQLCENRVIARTVRGHENDVPDGGRQ